MAKEADSVHFNTGVQPLAGVMNPNERADSLCMDVLSGFVQECLGPVQRGDSTVQLSNQRSCCQRRLDSDLLIPSFIYVKLYLREVIVAALDQLLCSMWFVWADAV